jgi:DNA-binding response OmpR family regulator
MIENLSSSEKLKFILLAEDDDDDQKIFSDAIDEAGIKVKLEIFNNGITLMSFLNGDHELNPDILFLDINMPLKSGIQCLEEIRNIKKWANLPVIIYSTSSYPPDIEETYIKGADLYFMKPNSFIKLSNSLKTILGKEWNNTNALRNFNDYIFL